MMKLLWRDARVAVCLLLATVTAAPTEQSTSSFQPRAEQLDEYEYVVVGSGAGGGPLAARLALAGHKTLLLEAGDDQGSNIKYQVPAFHPRSTEEQSMQWDYYVKHYEDDERAKLDTKMTWDTPSGEVHVGRDPPQGSKMKGILYPRAGTYGGCGSHNALITVYPHESDWAHIADITGDDSWSPQNMRKYFAKLEDNQYTLPGLAPGHGWDGWLSVDRASLTNAIKDIRILSLAAAAASALGEGILGPIVSGAAQLTSLLLRDLNKNGAARDSAQGLYQIPISVKDGIRIGSRNFIVSVAESDAPLTIQPHTLVTKILFSNDSTPRAIGVEYLTGASLYRADPRSASANGDIGRVSASCEVILSAGAFNTPQLLKLSGIGPAEELASHNIPLVVDSPAVGTNLQDRYESGVTIKFSTNTSLSASCTFRDDASQDPCLKQWQTNKLDKGVYATNGFAAAALTRSKGAATSDIDLFTFGGPADFRGYYPGYSADAVADAKHWTWAVLKAHTGNTAGTVKLRSADPRDTPLINFNYFDTGTTGGADTRDLDAVVEGLKLGRKINGLLNLLAGQWEEVAPGRDVSTDEQLREYVRDNAWGHHASCSVPIGKDGDEKAVLDGDFRVRGVEGLRVADASVFPRIPGIFIVSAVYMVAEKAADVILAAAK